MAFTLLLWPGLSTANAQEAASSDATLTVLGVTLYGTVDIGLQYNTEAAPESDYFPSGVVPIVQKNSRESIFAVTPSNSGLSRVGLKGAEALGGGWSGIFKLETVFNPQSADLADGLKALALNNGRTVSTQNTAADTSFAGQLFGGAAFAGLSHAQFGTLTFGRQTGLLADGIALYDPMGASLAFSVIGYSGVAAGAGDTEDRRLDSSLKYNAQLGPIRLGAQYQFNDVGTNVGAAVELELGATLRSASIDAFYVKKRDAISANSLSAPQVAGLGALGYSDTNALAATVSDNSAFSVMASYRLGAPTVLVGYEYIEYANPANPLAAGTATIGGYVLAYVNNTAYPSEKILQVYWAGLRLKYNERLDLTAAYYGYRQNSYATGAAVGCTNSSNGACSGELAALSLKADYQLSRRFYVYAGAMWSHVQNGLANGYLNTTTIDPTIGVRFTF